MLNRWPQQLAQTLVSGQLTPVLSAHLDPLLLWLSHPDHPQVAPLALALDRAGLTRSTATRQAYLLLDQLLFSGVTQAPTTLGLAAHTAPTLVKQRYRRLLQVYHPDRHATRPLWATQRTERINLAFQAHRRGTHGWTSQASAAPPTVATSASRSWRVSRRWKIIGLGLATTGIALISSVLLLTAPTPPRSPPLHLPLSITAPPAAPVIEPPAAPPPVIVAAAEPEPTPAPPAAIAPPAALVPAENAAPVSVEPTVSAPPPAELPPRAAEEPPPAPPAVTIPTPIPPTAPTQPPVPTLTTTALDCRAVTAQLQQFQQAYNTGALEHLMTLYSPAARENDLANWESIRQTYTDWFRTTSQRQIQFTKLHIKQTSNHCAVIAVYQVRYHTAQQQPTTQTGIIEFLFEQRGVAMQILRVRY